MITESLTNNHLQLASHMCETSWEWILQPQLSLQMTASLAKILNMIERPRAKNSKITLQFLTHRNDFESLNSRVWLQQETRNAECGGILVNPECIHCIKANEGIIGGSTTQPLEQTPRPVELERPLSAEGDLPPRRYQHRGSLPSQPLRIPRYADAIFTNSYRKILGQLSARKLLQDIMNRQQGERNQEQGAKVRLGRQVDSVWTDQQQMALESILVSLLQERRNSQG
ncbi:hypothetical protein R6Z07F_012546 [Ovis aries]